MAGKSYTDVKALQVKNKMINNMVIFKVDHMRETPVNATVPKLEKSVVMDNPQTRRNRGTQKLPRVEFLNKNFTEAMAYFLGSYFSDGSISIDENRSIYRYAITVVDKDFIENVRNASSTFLNRVNDIYLCKAQSGFANGKQVYRYHISCRELVEWMRDVTKSRAEIPKEIVENSALRKAFLAGFMDGDGYASMCMNIRIGFRLPDKRQATNIGDLFIREGCKLGKFEIVPSPKPGGKTMFGYTVNTESFLKSGVNFTMARKKMRVNFARIMRRVSTTLRQPLNEILIDIFSGKIKSELNGDIESYLKTNSRSEEEKTES